MGNHSDGGTAGTGTELARSGGARSGGQRYILSIVHAGLGNLDRASRVVELQGFVNAAPEFEEHPQVLNGCSDLMVEVLGPKGAHARSVFGATSLRAGLPIIIDSIFEIER